SELLLKEEDYEEVLTLMNSLETEEQPLAGWMIAQAYNGLEAFDQANEAYDKVKDVLIEEPDFMKDYGLFLREEGRREEANTWLTRYLASVPGDLEVASLIDNEGW
ncbi:MAG: hypothetical protein RR968_07350, partial [Vagococcus sp.]